jgi:ABC-type phosphate transport system permease subunit
MTDLNDKFPLYTEPFDMVEYITDNIASLPTFIIGVVVLSIVLFLLSGDRYDK